MCKFCNKIDNKDFCRECEFRWSEYVLEDVLTEGLFTEHLEPYDRIRLYKPRWNQAGRVHDWRNYVPEYVQNVWTALDDTTKEIVYLMAEKQADMEYWD